MYVFGSCIRGTFYPHSLFFKQCPDIPCNCTDMSMNWAMPVLSSGEIENDLPGTLGLGHPPNPKTNQTELRMASKVKSPSIKKDI